MKPRSESFGEFLLRNARSHLLNKKKGGIKDEIRALAKPLFPTPCRACTIELNSVRLELCPQCYAKGER